MNGLRNIPAGLLLVVLIVGGSMAPSWHRAEEAIEAGRYAALSRLAHADHDHASGPLVESPVVDDDRHAPCLLCHHRVDWVAATDHGTPQRTRYAGATHLPTWPAASHIAGPRSIRGPPVRA